ncbi:hypothetical protein BLNAU_15099 [Blattamonas nauphoetae]|uniref:Uncharacterized protein n=1 Tax=Blattamonas nauphoetae TaxID=2049346 RepID=A0ABQ9XBQ9_9EUKA|nr:hypothetical protein BLNAU_15099 [Blattamonas nauphoetae]
MPLLNLPALILVHLLWVEATSTKRTFSPLSLQMAFVHDTKAANISGNDHVSAPEVHLDYGTYHSNAFLLDSASLSLHGSDTTICHTSSLVKAETVNDQDLENNEYEKGNSTPFIFVFSNSTISMSHISLDCGWRGTSVGRISSSRLTIENCPIISNPESSPFVMNNGWDDFGSSIFFVDCSHKSIDKLSLLPLVSFTPSHITHASHTDDVSEMSPTLVSCSGLSLCDTKLEFGSGPLVAFSSSTEQYTGFSNRLETILIGSKLVNMTSGKGKGVLEGWSGSQKILDSYVTLGTDHLYGTTCIDMNLGGSLLCSNTSFSHCHSSLEPEFIENKTYTLQHRKGNEFFKINRFNTEDVTFCHCTFLSIASNNPAIYRYSSPISITVSESSFSNCSMLSEGAAILSVYTGEGDSLLTISSSLFVDCTANKGGAINVRSGTVVTVTNSVFCDNTASSEGGALHVSYSVSFIMSNCVFERCVASGSSSLGGGAYLSQTPSVLMDSVRFRGCSGWRGNDVHLYSGVGTIEELAPNITNCDSTSEMPNVVQHPVDYDDTLIPAVPEESTADFVTIGNTPSEDMTSSTIQMRVSQNVDGEMFVLVDNTNKYTQPNDDSPPAIARLLTFDFSSSTESASQTVSFGEWEVLQYESEYRVIGLSIANTRLSTPSSITLTTPNPPRIVQVICSPGSGTEHCWLQLKGRTLTKGTYTVTLTNPDLSFSVEFDGSKDETTLNMFSSLHSEKLFGDGSRLTFVTKYEVASITLEGSSEPLILDPRRLFFTTPGVQPCLISVGPIRYQDSLKQDILYIPFTTMYALYRTCTVELLSSSSESVSLTVPFSNRNSSTIAVVVYSKDPSEIKLKYGPTYTVKAMETETTEFLLGSVLSIEVPPEPMRIEEGCVTLNEAKDEATVRLKGEPLVDGIYTLSLAYVWSELTSEAVLSDAGELLFKVEINTSYSSILTYGQTYTVSLLKLGSDTGLVNSDIKLKVPSVPMATATSCDLGRSRTGTLTELVYKSRALQYNESYTIVSLESSTHSVLIKDKAGFVVPEEPKQIEEGRVTLNGAKTEATVRLKGRALTDETYTLKLNSVSSEQTSEAFLSNDGELLFKVPISNSSSSILTFGTTYKHSSHRMLCDVDWNRLGGWELAEHHSEQLVLLHRNNHLTN